MPASVGSAKILLAAAIVILAGCGGPGLPPAGPEPGDVDVGYGTQKEGQVTGAVTSISEKEVSNASSLRIEELLRGRVPGLQLIQLPGGRISFRIRGNSSIRNEQEPLFVIDGVQISAGGVQSALASLAVEDVRQIDVLKDVASTAIYGMRGAGGVIIITTRR
jgi:TonB-dependent SusC/RagA subfamily outer membrane receptor